MSDPPPLPSTPPAPPEAPRHPAEPTLFDRLVPTRNPAALAGYYLGVFSFVPALGLLLGIPAIVCGIVGLVAAAREPERKGQVHAWVAIALGFVGQPTIIAVIYLYMRWNDW